VGKIHRYVSVKHSLIQTVIDSDYCLHENYLKYIKEIHFRTDLRALCFWLSYVLIKMLKTNTVYCASVSVIWAIRSVSFYIYIFLFTFNIFVIVR
jgi:hypothetical protein